MEISRGGDVGKQMQYWGTLKHKKINFHFFFFGGGGGASLSFFQGNKRTGTPTPTGGLHIVNYWKAHIICKFNAF